MKNPEIIIRRLNDDRAFACYYKGDYENQSGKIHKLLTFSLLATRDFTPNLYDAISHLIKAHDRHDKDSESILQQFHFYKVYSDNYFYGSACTDNRIQLSMSPIDLPTDNTESKDDSIITMADIEAINNFIIDIRDEMHDDHYNDAIRMMINDNSNTSSIRILTAYSLSSDRLKDKDYISAMMKCLNGTMISKYHYKDHSNETQMWCKNCHHMYHSLMNYYYYMGNRVIYNTLATPKNIKDEKKVLDISEIKCHECVKGVIGREVDFLKNNKEDNTNTNDFNFHDKYLLVPSTMYDIDTINESNMKLRYVRCYNCGTLYTELLV